MDSLTPTCGVSFAAGSAAVLATIVTENALSGVPHLEFAQMGV